MTKNKQDIFDSLSEIMVIMVIEICERLWQSSHLLLGGSSSGSGESDSDLEGIIDTPLKSSEGTNHEDSEGKASGTETNNSHLFDDGSDGCLTAGIELRDKVISRVGHNGTEYTSNVTGEERDSKLFSLCALSLRLGHNIGIEGDNGILKTSKLHHSVRNLSSPKRNKTPVETSNSIFSNKLGVSITKSVSKSRHSLDLDLDSFHGAKSNISEELGRSGSGKEDGGLVGISVVSSHVGVVFLEELVETEFAGSL